MKLRVIFYKTDSGREPVRLWLKKLDLEDRKTIGGDILTVQYGFPLGMPLVRGLGYSIHEVRSNITDGKIARVLFYINNQKMILLHGFIKKTQKTTKQDLRLALERKKNHEKGE